MDNLFIVEAKYRISFVGKGGREAICCRGIICCGPQNGFENGTKVYQEGVSITGRSLSVSPVPVKRIISLRLGKII